jgi:hypothetical protein
MIEVRFVSNTTRRGSARPSGPSLIFTDGEARMQHGVDFALIAEMREWAHSVITGEPVITEKPPSAP